VLSDRFNSDAYWSFVILVLHEFRVSQKRFFVKKNSSRDVTTFVRPSGDVLVRSAEYITLSKGGKDSVK
jgi:hypothetical protein